MYRRHLFAALLIVLAESPLVSADRNDQVKVQHAGDVTILERVDPDLELTTVIRGDAVATIGRSWVGDRAVCELLYLSASHWIVECAVFEEVFHPSEFARKLFDPGRGRRFGRTTVLLGAESCPLWLGHSLSSRHLAAGDAWMRRELAAWSAQSRRSLRSTAAHVRHVGTVSRRTLDDLVTENPVPHRLRSIEVGGEDALLDRVHFRRPEDAREWLEDRLASALAWRDEVDWWDPVALAGLAEGELVALDPRGALDAPALSAPLVARSPDGLLVGGDVVVEDAGSVSFLAAVSPPRLIALSLAATVDGVEVVQLAAGSCRAFVVPQGEATVASMCRLNQGELRLHLPPRIFAVAEVLLRSPDPPWIARLLACADEKRSDTAGASLEATAPSAGSAGSRGLKPPPAPGDVRLEPPAGEEVDAAREAWVILEPEIRETAAELLADLG